MKAAAILKVSTLKHWIGKSWSASYFSDCLESIKRCCASLIFEPIKILNDQANESERPSTPPSGRSVAEDFLNDLFDHDSPESDDNTEIQLENFNHKVFLEVESFRKILSENNFKFLSVAISTKSFWLKRNSEFPILCKLSLLLNNINSSSAFIERYFSICGFIQNKRAANIAVDLFIARCFLRANIKILNEIKKIVKLN